MQKSINARERLLEVISILEKNTDEEDMKTLHEIHAMLPEHSNVGVGTVREDLLALEDSYIYPILSVQEKVGMQKHYHYDGRLFEIHELRLLMDAISAAKFIPQSETNGLLMKIRKLTSKRLAKQLNNELYVVNEAKYNLVEVTKVVEQLHTGIQDQKVIAFKYGRYGTDLKFHLSNNEDDYLVKPYGLVWNSDRYYLVGEYIAEGDIRQYRVDRMRSVQVTDDNFVPDPDFNLKNHVSKMFHMYGGEPLSLEAVFSNELINVVIDRFGTDANIQAHGPDSFVLKTRAIMSDGLVQWLMRFGYRVKVVHPETLVNQMKEEAKKFYENYHE